MTNLTTKEALVLKAISTDCFMDGAEGKDAVGKYVWADTGADHIRDETKLDAASIGGIVASLSKKGLISYNHDGQDSTYALTCTGAAEIWPEAFGGEFPIA